MSRRRVELQTLRRGGGRSTTVVAAVLAATATGVLGAAVLMTGLPSAEPEPTPESAAADLSVEVVADHGEDDGAASAFMTPVVTYELFLARDPFEPVIPEAQPDAVADPTAPGDPAPADPTDPLAPTTPAAPGTTQPPGTTAPSGSGAERVCPSGPEVVCEGRVLTAVDIFRADDGELVAVIQVDTTVFEVRRGQEFSSDPTFVVLNITDTTVTLQNGDAAFTLSTGDSVLK